MKAEYIGIVESTEENSCVALVQNYMGEGVSFVVPFPAKVGQSIKITLELVETD